jgi:SAM-dependent methyltransferase
LSGSGFLSGHLTDLLKTRDDLIVEYVVSDPFLTLADAAARATSYKWISGKVYDMTEEPEKQGFALGTFDIITAFNALHVTDVPFTLSSLQRLLVPGGSLLVAELDGSSHKNEKPGSIWMDTVFGSLPGWFNSLFTPDQWKSSLSSTGYVDIQTSTDLGNGLELVFAAQSPSFTPVAAPIRPKNTMFVPFKYGQEIAAQESLAKLDINENLSVWLLAEAGIDGDAAVGLTRCLIIEMNTWKVHLAIFEGTTKESEQVDAILRYRQFVEEENIVRFGKNGEPYLPKLAPTSPPPSAVKFDPTGTWLLEGSEIIQSSLSPLAGFQVSVEVFSWSEAVGSFRGFTGAVVESKDSHFYAGQVVIGISDLPLSNKVVSHAGLLALAPGNNEKLAGDALAILIGTLVLGPTRTTRSSRSPPLRILATDTQTLGKALANFFSTIPSVAHFWLGQASLKPSEEAFDIVISDSATLVTKPEIAPTAKKLFVWDTIVREMVNTDPYSVGYALEVGLQLGSPYSESAVIYPRDLIREKVGSLVSTQVPLFSANKAYILIGGMSDVGIHVSTWMYKV